MDPNVLRLAMGAAAPSGPEYKLYTWGLNNFGQIGDGTTTWRSSPTQIGAGSSWTAVGVGHRFTLAVKDTGSLWSWGVGSNGELGLGNQTNYSSPKQVGALTNWSKVYGGTAFSVAIKTDGTLWTWGSPNDGRLGFVAATTYVTSPTQVGSLTNWSIAAPGQNHCAAIKTDGTLWVWGSNSYGKLGLGNTTNYSSPKQVGTATNWSSVSCGEQHIMAVKTNGTLWAIGGYNGQGELGLGNITSYSSPVQVGSNTNWSKVSCHSYGTIALKTDGTLWGWGGNYWGQLGLGDNTDRSSPVQIG